MTELDYKELGFKAGLEIHQQLDTKKLFCNCPTILRNDSPDFQVHRKLHAVAGQSGKVDVAAQYQASLGKEYSYEFHRENNCLVELDEEPPKEIDQEALKVTLQISLLLNCKIFQKTQIMRKTVVDGSNTSGFQRTVLIARDGHVETSYGKVGIETICLEEDSARKTNEEENKTVFRLDRLGTPLVEIVTSPDIQNPEQAKEAALQIGEILRSCKVKRGLGTIRQDVNLSIRAENRVEMKGVQDMKTFVQAIENEVQRQKELSDQGKPTEKEVRKVIEDTTSKFIRPMPGADRMYPETDLPLLKIHRNTIDNVKKNLPKLKSELREELKKKGLGEEMIRLLLKQERVEEYKELLNYYDNPEFVAKMMLIFPKEIASKKGLEFNEVENKVSDFYEDILQSIAEEKIEESDVKEVFSNLLVGKPFKEAIKIEKADTSQVENRVKKIIEEKPGLNPNAYMGLVMKEFKGQIDGKTAMELINKYANQK
ncbi:MAG: Glu-tRNA(Gln) amidotransferase subunit GatE [Candidatus Pacearchaeota archaeon]